MRWKRSILLAAALMLPFAACGTDGDDAGTEEVEAVPETNVIEEEEPDVIIQDERDEGFEGEINIDEEGNVSGGVRVEDDEP